jgi:hypothetical protein
MDPTGTSFKRASGAAGRYATLLGGPDPTALAMTALVFWPDSALLTLKISCFQAQGTKAEPLVSTIRWYLGFISDPEIDWRR